MTEQTQEMHNLQPTAETQPIGSDFSKLLAKEKSLELSSFNHETYDQLFRLAEVMADSGVVPDSLKSEGKKGAKRPLDRKTVIANCFLVAEQAHRWQVSPFTILGEAAIVYGKLAWEGKTINALIQKFAGIFLKFEYNEGSGDSLGITVSGTLPNETEPRTIPGTVKAWKSTGEGSPWVMSDEIALKRQLAYRGAREWMRIHLPSVMHGVLAIDEVRNFEAEKPEPQIVTREQMSEQSLPAETKQVLNESNERVELLAKCKQAWKALKKTDADKRTMLDYYELNPKQCDFEDLSNDQLKRLLTSLQKQMNEQAGKTIGQIEAEKAQKGGIL